MFLGLILFNTIEGMFSLIHPTRQLTSPAKMRGLETAYWSFFVPVLKCQNILKYFFLSFS